MFIEIFKPIVGYGLLSLAIGIVIGWILRGIWNDNC